MSSHFSLYIVVVVASLQKLSHSASFSFTTVHDLGVTLPVFQTRKFKHTEVRQIPVDAQLVSNRKRT